MDPLDCLVAAAEQRFSPALQQAIREVAMVTSPEEAKRLFRDELPQAVTHSTALWLFREVEPDSYKARRDRLIDTITKLLADLHFQPGSDFSAQPCPVRGRVVTVTPAASLALQGKLSEKAWHTHRLFVQLR